MFSPGPSAYKVASKLIISKPLQGGQEVEVWLTHPVFRREERLNCMEKEEKHERANTADLLLHHS